MRKISLLFKLFSSIYMHTIFIAHSTFIMRKIGKDREESEEQIE